MKSSRFSSGIVIMQAVHTDPIKVPLCLVVEEGITVTVTVLELVSPWHHTTNTDVFLLTKQFSNASKDLQYCLARLKNYSNSNMTSACFPSFLLSSWIAWIFWGSDQLGDPASEPHSLVGEFGDEGLMEDSDSSLTTGFLPRKLPTLLICTTSSTSRLVGSYLGDIVDKNFFFVFLGPF